MADIYCSICGISFLSPDGQLRCCQCCAIESGTHKHPDPPELSESIVTDPRPLPTAPTDVPSRSNYRRPIKLTTTPLRQSTRRTIDTPSQSTNTTPTPSHYRQMPQQQQQPTGRNLWPLFGGCQPGVQCVLSFETPEETADHIEQYH